MTTRIKRRLFLLMWTPTERYMARSRANGFATCWCRHPEGHERIGLGWSLRHWHRWCWRTWVTNTFRLHSSWHLPRITTTALEFWANTGLKLLDIDPEGTVTFWVDRKRALVLTWPQVVQVIENLLYPQVNMVSENRA